MSLRNLIIFILLISVFSASGRYLPTRGQSDSLDRLRELLHDVLEMDTVPNDQSPSLIIYKPSERADDFYDRFNNRIPIDYDKVFGSSPISRQHYQFGQQRVQKRNAPVQQVKTTEMPDYKQ